MHRQTFQVPRQTRTIQTPFLNFSNHNHVVHRFCHKYHTHHTPHHNPTTTINTVINTVISTMIITISAAPSTDGMGTSCRFRDDDVMIFPRSFPCDFAPLACPPLSLLAPCFLFTTPHRNTCHTMVHTPRDTRCARSTSHSASDPLIHTTPHDGTTFPHDGCQHSCLVSAVQHSPRRPRPHNARSNPNPILIRHAVFKSHSKKIR